MNTNSSTEQLRLGGDYYGRDLPPVETKEQCAQELVNWINDGIRASGDGWGMSAIGKKALRYYFIRMMEIREDAQ